MTGPLTHDQWRRMLASAQPTGNTGYLFDDDQVRQIEATIENGFAPDPIADIQEISFKQVGREIVENLTGETQRVRRRHVQAGDTIWHRHKLDEGRIGHVTPVLVADRKGEVVRLKTLDDPGAGDWFALEDLRIYHVERGE